MVMGMYKLLVNSPAGGQEVFEVSLSGGYFDEARVIWDERVDGPITEGLVLGGMVRQVEDGLPRLVFDQTLFDQNAEPESVAVPIEVSSFQLEVALLDAGHALAVYGLFESCAPKLRIDWQRRDRQSSDGAVAQELAELLQFSAAEVREVFKAAAEVQ